MIEELKKSDRAEWTTVIDAHPGWLDVRFRELWRYRDLILLFVRRDFVAVYKQTILGPVWFLLQPLLTTLVFTVVFGKIARIPTDGLPPVLFYMSGIVAWQYFANCLTKTSNTFLGNASIFGKVYFPRLTVPVAIAISNIIMFGVQMVLFLGFFAYFYIQGAAIRPSIALIWIPLLILQMAALGLGLGILISALTVRYRDLKFLLAFGVQLWMYATPIVYPISEVPEEWQWAVALNPMAPVIEMFRYAFLGAGTVSLWHILIGAVTSLLIFVAGLVVFTRVEKNFVDTI